MLRYRGYFVYYISIVVFTLIFFFEQYIYIVIIPIPYGLLGFIYFIFFLGKYDGWVERHKCLSACGCVDHHRHPSWLGAMTFGSLFRVGWPSTTGSPSRFVTQMSLLISWGQLCLLSYYEVVFFFFLFPPGGH